MTTHTRMPQLYPAAILPVVLIASVFSPVSAHGQDVQGETQEFVVTAYYSPLPDQCCYAFENYEADIAFNGEGIRGASGEGVRPGMIAAPKTYAFGTRIELPDLGLGTVLDRGGRIIEWENDVHRIDIWMGYGEEGLARAMQFGTQRMTGTVYPVSSLSRTDTIDLATIAAPTSILVANAATTKTLLTADSAYGDNSHAVRLLQETLKERGYFSRAVTTTYGDETKAALAAFLRERGIDGDGSVADDRVRSYLLASKVWHKDRSVNLAILSKGETGPAVAQAQRVLRFVGAYKGRTDGVFDDDMAAQIAAFQLKHHLIASVSDAGAGRLGPKTRQTAIDIWRGKQLARAAKRVEIAMHVERTLQEQLQQTLARGDSGDQVSFLQRSLALLGYFPMQSVNGIYGSQTEEAVRSYQLSRGIIGSTAAKGNGIMGPVTRASFLRELVSVGMQTVRSQGVGAL